MEVYCTRPHCPRPQNYFPDLDNITTLQATQQKYCVSCGMPLLLDGRYLPVKLLGIGGFGAAFLARDRRIPGIPNCVVKQFQPSTSLNAAQLDLAQELFEREATVLADVGMNHDQIPYLFAFFPVVVPSLQPGRQDQFFYLVQEYIDGKNLEEELQHRGNFSETEVLVILKEILPVLQFIHDRGIIHRDIKPSNIMRRQDGRLFLLDFGSVKQVTSAKVSSASTAIYTPGFAAPEQTTRGQVFPSTDIYALGVTILTLLTGKEATELFDPQINQWRWRQEVKISPHLSGILDKMLMPAINERFSSATEVLSALIPSITIPDQPQPSNLPFKGLMVKKFSFGELLLRGAVTGFEGALIVIAVGLLVETPIIRLAISLVMVSSLVVVQSQGWLAVKDLLLILLISFLVIFLIALLPGGLDIQIVVVLGIASALICIGAITLFSLIHKILSTIL
ncbi:serine/threonine-protein kinase [Cylindrospermopsis raciborskii]|jgi:serine/threonine-protein kinase|uniref:serine/threonine-protein kinase n=1 Tax=Cylindrospermopsis raciborskii TaxID=77022 RepID=UPI000E1F7133|nr:serine/threonine-protein kinase [Cylindrospermopsis raciborskii]TPX27808.1 serine/threonine protein kinase [Cylindrospermopsis raciborskii GIHE 2018]UJL34897.1 serine/threonine protein kinase [Cylindrospermopsis raciborskii Cr2010]UJS04417.1 serine/threonine protein kinase [Cylindrospermopsis raciborskii KLL07]